MKTIFRAGVAVMVFSAAMMWTPASFAFRCGTSLISEGDRRPRVIELCGEPDHVETWQEERVFSGRGTFFRPEDGHASDRIPEPDPLLVKKSVTVEQWTYNLGPNRFVRYMTFENGTLVSITTGEHGY